MAPLSYDEVQRAFTSGAIYGLNLPELYASLQIVNAQSGFGDPRPAALAATIQSLINSHENRIRHQRDSDQAKEHHREAQEAASKVSEEIVQVKSELENVKRKMIEIKDVLKDTHGIHLWILVVSILALIAAAIAATDVIGKWFPKNSSVVVSAPTRPELTNSTNR